MNKKILAFTGQIASGKGTACAFFVDRYEARLVKFSSILRDVLDRLYLAQSRDTMQQLSFALRGAFGQDIFAKAIANDVTTLNAPLIVIDGVRRPYDVECLKVLDGFHLIAIETDERLRYDRVIKRNENHGDAEKSWEQFLADEQADAEASIPEIMKQANEYVHNNGSLDDFYRQLEAVYLKIMKA